MTAALVPTARAAALAGLAAPLALLLAVTDPGAWVVAPALAAALIFLVAIDGLFAGRLIDLTVAAPAESEVGEPLVLCVVATLAGGRPAGAEAAVALDPRLAPGGRLVLQLVPDAGDWRGEAHLVPTRRGPGSIDRIWLRWTGPLGLGARQRCRAVDTSVRVRPSLAAARSPALHAFLRESEPGLIARRIRGEGTHFEALAEYHPGMDRRRIDWKSSARHARLQAREYEVERNNQIVFAIDCGRAMCEPVGGLPRLDRAVSAALAAAFVALKGGDRAALFAFAARPEIATPFAAGTRGFLGLQSAAAQLDYHAQEPNFTLALATLAGRLQRRSLIVVFSDFTDPTSAELMVEAIGRLLARHLVLFVTMADEELETLVADVPADLPRVARAVNAQALLHQRQLVMARLQHLGVMVIEAPYQQIGTRLIDAYLQIKRAGRIG